MPRTPRRRPLRDPIALADGPEPYPKPRGQFGETAARWGPVVLWMGVIFVASGDQFSARQTGTWLAAFLHVFVGDLDAESFATVHATVRKAAHLVEYAVLGALALRAIGWRSRALARSCVLSIAFAAFWAITDEMHQSFIPSRTASALDVLIDTVGASVGVLVRWRWMRLRAGRVVGAVDGTAGEGEHRATGEHRALDTHGSSVR